MAVVLPVYRGMAEFWMITKAIIRKYNERTKLMVGWVYRLFYCLTLVDFFVLSWLKTIDKKVILMLSLPAKWQTLDEHNG